MKLIINIINLINCVLWIIIFYIMFLYITSGNSIYKKISCLGLLLFLILFIFNYYLKWKYDYMHMTEQEQKQAIEDWNKRHSNQTKIRNIGKTIALVVVFIEWLIYFIAESNR